MTDRISKERRSWNMGRIRNKDTSPELRVRSILHREGYRFRLQNKNLPGKPDIVLPRFKTVVFVHGCFWHRHAGCSDATVPKTRTEFWVGKFETNIRRDSRAVQQLQDLGWRVIVVWECELKNSEVLKDRLLSEIGSSGRVI